MKMIILLGSSHLFETLVGHLLVLHLAELTVRVPEPGHHASGSRLPAAETRLAVSGVLAISCKPNERKGHFLA